MVIFFPKAPNQPNKMAVTRYNSVSTGDYDPNHIVLDCFSLSTRDWKLGNNQQISMKFSPFGSERKRRSLLEVMHNFRTELPKQLLLHLNLNRNFRSTRPAYYALHWIVIYPVDSVIHLWNNPGLRTTSRFAWLFLQEIKCA